MWDISISYVHIHILFPQLYILNCQRHELIVLTLIQILYLCSSWICLWFPHFLAVCVSVTVLCGIWCCFMENRILTFQRHLFPSSSRVTPGITDPWRRRLCVLLKRITLTHATKFYPKRTESPATLLQKSGNPQFQASLISTYIAVILFMVHITSSLTIRHGPFLYQQILATL